MEDTLESIRPSENPEMSYLFGRDPSILAYNQRPLPSKNTKKNLLSLYEAEENTATKFSENSENLSENSESQNTQTIKVYLRLKPFPKKLKLTEEQQNAYEIVNSMTLLTKLPILDSTMTSVKQSKSIESICKKFTFSQTFGPETTQLELFEQIVQQQIIDFLAGHSCTIMTYGTTNSGKSYTLQGTLTSPGLLPRALEFIFSNITTKPNPLYKPLHCCDVVGLSALDRAQELEAKTKLLTFSSVDKNQCMKAYKQMQKLLQEELIRPGECRDAHYSIWVSFAEIYNEIVYDLLSNECQKKRVPLKLGTDASGRAFIKGLRTVYVNSAAEAYQVLMAGQYNLKVAATALNAKSSRSHCIFTIILLKYYAENQPDTVEVSTFSFCDLAGSERLKKTLNVGDRLREAQNINTSLLVLGRCLKSIHEGQTTRTRPDAVGPFRESKLTRLFQRALSGKEHLALIVNVNPLPNLYVETQNVLNFAAIAKKIVIEKKEAQKKRPKSRFSQIVMQSAQTVTDWDADLETLGNADSRHAEDIPEEVTSDYLTSEEYLEIAKENESLKKEIAVLKHSALLRDFQSRQEMAEHYMTKINELEVNWKKRINDVEAQHEDNLEWTVKQIEDFYQNKLSQMRKRKRLRTDEDEDDEDTDSPNSALVRLSEENVKLREENERLQKSLIELRITNETLIVEKNKAYFELGLSKDDVKSARGLLEAAEKDIKFNENGKAFTREMKSQLAAKDEQIKKLKNVLNEAKDEYIAITSDLRRKELCIDEQAKVIVEHEEKIEDLESDLEQINFCLAEKNNIVEILEEKLERQNEQLSDSEDRITQLQEEIGRLRSERPTAPKSPEPSRTAPDEYEEIIVKEELIISDTSNLSDVTKTAREGTAPGGETGSTELHSRVEALSGGTSVPSDVAQPSVVRDEQTFVEVGCQADMNNPREETAVQTDEPPDDEDDDARIQLEELTARYNDAQARYERGRARVEELTDELRGAEETLRSLTEENRSNKAAVEEYEHSVQLLKQQLSRATEDERRRAEEALSSNAALERRIADCERENVELKRELAVARGDAQQSLEKLETIRREFDGHILKYKEMEETNTRELDAAREADEASSKQLVELKEKVLELERSAEIITKLKHRIDELNRDLETCEMERNSIREALEENERRLLELEGRLAEAARKEQEKDVEIATLQRELKHSIQRNESAARTGDAMETELKTAMSELARTKEALQQREQDVKELSIRVENFEKNAKFINLFEETAKERQVENERLRSLNEELRTNLTQKEREMDAFMRNRDETVTKYEALVKNQQEDLDRQKREVMRYQELFRRQLTPTPKDDYKKLQDLVDTLQERLHKYEAGDRARDYCDTTSEDDDSVKSQRTKPRRGKKAASRVKQEEHAPVLESTESESKRNRKAVSRARQEYAPEIELSESESKRNTRRAALPPPGSSNDTKRTTRRKKLFVDDSLVDIEPAESAPTRTLRNRRK